jgi:hypothetical protein
VGFYNLDDSVNLKAYYTFNPGAFLVDGTGITGSLTASASSPTAQASGPFGADSNSVFLTASTSQFFTLPSLTLPDAFSVCAWFWISPSMVRNYNRIFDLVLAITTFLFSIMLEQATCITRSMLVVHREALL